MRPPCPHRRLAPAAAALLAAALAAPAGAAPSYDGCTGFIVSLPTTVTTQGTWCMNGDLSTSIASGAAITIATNNVTIDCNGFKLGGLGAGAGTAAAGIRAVGRRNAAIRGCNVRGFRVGVSLEAGGGSSGHLVEDNRFEANTVFGIDANGENITLRRNHVLDTGGSTGADTVVAGIRSGGESHLVADNTVMGVVGMGLFEVSAILLDSAERSIVRGNAIGGVVTGDFDAFGYGIDVDSSLVAVHGNDVTGMNWTGTTGIRCLSTNVGVHDNVVGAFPTAFSANCQGVAGNLVF